LSHQERASAIQELARRTGEQAGKLISDFLEGLLLLTLAQKTPLTALDFGEEPPPPDRLLTAQEVAKLLNVSKAKAYQLMQTGEIATVRMGRAVRVRRQDLDEFLRSRLA
jgi:excisionase family DNA binding protein